MADIDTDLESFRAEARHWLEENFPKSLARDAGAAQAAMSGAAELTGDQKLWKQRMADKGWGAPTSVSRR